VTFAEAEAVVLATLAAVTIQEDVAAAGAVNIPLPLIVPQVLDHVTAVFVAPVTVAVNFRVASTAIESVVGLMATETTEVGGFTGAGGSAGGGGSAATAIVTDPVPVPMLLVAEMGTSMLPVMLGVPEINPEVVFSKAQGGRPVASKLVGEPDAAIV